MTHVSRKRLEEDTQDILYKALVAVTSNLSFKEVQHLFSTLLTKTEKIMVMKRLGILYLLQETRTQEEIAKVLKTTRQTVARIQLQLLTIPEEDKKIVLEKLSSWKNFTLLKDTLTKAAAWAVKKVLRASVGKS